MESLATNNPNFYETTNSPLEGYDWLPFADITNESLSYPYAKDWLSKSPTREQVIKFPQELYLGSASLPNFDIQYTGEDPQVLNILSHYQNHILEYRALKAKLIQFSREYQGRYPMNVDNTHAHVNEIYSPNSGDTKGSDSIQNSNKSGDLVFFTNLDNEVFDLIDLAEKNELRAKFKNIDSLDSAEQRKLIKIARERNAYEILRLNRSNFQIDLVASNGLRTVSPIDAFKRVLNATVFQIHIMAGLSKTQKVVPDFTEYDSIRLFELYHTIKKIADHFKLNFT